MKYKKTVIIASILIILVSLFATFYYERYHYKVNGMTFTLLVKLGGNCYITPYEYTGIMAPKHEYIKIDKTDNILICLENESSFIIFESPSLAGEPNITYNFYSYKYKVFRRRDYHCKTDFQRSLELSEEYQKTRDYYVNNYSFIQMSLKEMVIYTDQK